SSLNWDLWLGPARARPYGVYADGQPAYHPFAWRGFWDFGTGALGDMACHIMNMPYMGLDLREPTSVEAETSGHNKDSYPKWSLTPRGSSTRFPSRAGGTGPAVTMTWYDGGKRPPAELLNGQARPGGGVLLIGEKGKMYSAGDTGVGYKLVGNTTEPKVEFP